VVAALATALEGAALFVGGVVLLVLEGTPQVWAFVVVLGAGIAAVGIALARGVRGARGPVVVVQLLGLGVAFYAGVTSGRPQWGVPIAVLCVAILAGVLTRAGRDWVEQ
jgi:drug/metabolite transporter (DMT)-like permease